MEQNWLESNVKNVKVRLYILEKLGNQVNSLLVLVILKIVAKKQKQNLVLANEVFKASTLSKSSFYQSLSDLQKFGFVKFENGFLSLTIKLYKSNERFLKFHYKNTLSLIGNKSAKQLILFFTTNLLLKRKKVEKVKSKISNERTCWKYCQRSGGCRGECEQTVITRNSQATFTFSFFKSWKFKNYQLSRFFKSLNFLKTLEEIFKIKISWKRSWEDYSFKTIHTAIKQTIKKYD